MSTAVVVEVMSSGVVVAAAHRQPRNLSRAYVRVYSIESTQDENGPSVRVYVYYRVVVAKHQCSSIPFHNTYDILTFILAGNR